MATTTLTLTPVHPHLGVEVRGVDLAEPLDAATFGAIRAAFEEHSVLVFHGQSLTDDQQVAFSERFGPLEETLKSRANYGGFRKEIADISNVDRDGAIIPTDDLRMLYHSGNQLWHSDSSFKRVPALASLLSGREVPPVGGETEFASTRVAYARLDAVTRQQIEGLVCVHDFAYSRGLVRPGLLTPEQQAQVPPVEQALVLTNPANGRRSLLVGSHAREIVGMPLDEGRRLLGRLVDLATEPAYVYRHAWRPGDLVIWDNRAVLHRGRPWDGTRYRRVMHRTTVAGAGPTVAR